MTGNVPINDVCQMRREEKSSTPHPWPVAISGLSIVCSLVLTACMSLDQMAPPVGQIVTALNGDASDRVTFLDRGRRIYLTQCSTCHSIEPIDRYSVEQWEDILPDMALETNLSEQERSSLRNYILTAHDFIRRQREHPPVAQRTSN